MAVPSYGLYDPGFMIDLQAAECSGEITAPTQVERLKRLRGTFVWIRHTEYGMLGLRYLLPLALRAWVGYTTQ
jgi:hypothetical protein